MESFKSFDKFITPAVIKVLYWIALVLVIIAGVVMFILGLIKLSGLMILQGILTAVLGPLVVRIYAELMMLYFRMYDVLIEIRDKGAAPPAA